MLLISKIMKRKILFPFALLIIISLPFFVSCTQNSSIEIQSPELKIMHDKPALSWENEAFPLGNGYMGSMIFGGVELDRIQINEHTLWSGGPGKNPAYNGGHNPERSAAENKEALQKARRMLQDKMIEFSANQAAYINDEGQLISNDYIPESDELRRAISATMGVKEDFGSYQTLGELIIHNFSEERAYTDYERILDIDNALVYVSYNKGDTSFMREYFMSYPKNVMAIKYTANKKGALSQVVNIKTLQPNVAISFDKDVITMLGRPSDHGSEGLKFAQQVKLIPRGGTVEAKDTAIVVKNADEILILMSAATNYQMCMDDSFNFFSDEDPLEIVKARLASASSCSYEKLRSEHIKDYKALFDKMQLSFADIAVKVEKPTDKLLEGYRKGTNLIGEDLFLELLYFQYGRYLLIASSRENTMPTNLQGIWAQGITNPWDADYHTNINLQMNYWLAEQTNLSSCHLPMIEYVKSLVPRGRITAKTYYATQDGKDVRGWTFNHENNIWANTAPATWYTAFYFPTAAAWCCQHIWEHYLFTGDLQFLNDNYKIIIDAALFWVDNLWEDERDGKLVTNPAYSPEHGNFSLGTSADQAIITELFDFAVKASEILGKASPEIEEIKNAKNRLLGPQIGLGDQFMEWRDEITIDITGDKHHRHVNHLHWLHPGSQIVAGRSANENNYVEAMKKTLETRGDGGTGWSKAWKINFWARLRDGNRAHKLLQELLKESTLDNLFDTHPPFQIDGNFGATAGVAEMLVQSQGGSIELLPALPEAWSKGAVKGIKARGNYELDLEWNNSMLEKLYLKSGADNICKLEYANISKAEVKENNKKIAFTVINDDEISFPTKKGKIYNILIK